jgi:hypothetical protein
MNISKLGEKNFMKFTARFGLAILKMVEALAESMFSGVSITSAPMLLTASKVDSLLAIPLYGSQRSNRW